MRMIRVLVPCRGRARSKAGTHEANVLSGRTAAPGGRSTSVTLGVALDAAQKGAAWQLALRLLRSVEVWAWDAHCPVSHVGKPAGP